MTPLDTVKAIYAAYSVGNIEAALAHCTDNICFKWNADSNLVRFGGTCMGKAEFLGRLMDLHDRYHYRSFRATALVAGEDRVAAQVEIGLTHRHSGREFTMHTANFWTIRGGKAVELVEYYDTAMIAELEKLEQLPSRAA